ncbi:hypothetical protein LJC12_01990 [Odoribacter sp. OttesenSCG-928-J03]|nr:hypothetical protein [Odoribacter sp. OttesenSCG-928-J03]MDL2330699.1 hypothetical protein [Odoribacter sp. OttesenSCG-928-A06]
MKKLIIQIVLAIAIVFVGYKCYESIMVPQRFQVVKKQRYDRIIERLKDIRSAQDAFKSVNNRYTASLDTLIHFIKYDSVQIVRSIGALTDEQIEKGMTEAEAIKQGFIIRDVVKVSALENVFGADYAIDNIRYVPFTNRKHQFRMGATTIRTDSGLEVPVFEARVSNMVIFENLDEEYHDYILQENGERIRLNKYPGLKVGDLEEANNNVGNWE